MRKNPKDEFSLAYLETITSQLVKIAMYITKERSLFIKNLSKLAQKNMLNISNHKEDLELKIYILVIVLCIMNLTKKIYQKVLCKPYKW